MSTDELVAALRYAGITLEYISKHPHQAERIACNAALSISELLLSHKDVTRTVRAANNVIDITRTDKT